MSEATIYQVILDSDRVVRAVGQSNVLNEGAIEIEEPTFTALMPLVGRAKLIDGEIGAYEPSAPPPDPFANFIPVPLLRQRIEALGMWDAFAAYLAQNPAEMLKVLTVETGVDPAYPALTVAFDAMDVPQAARDAILAPPSAGVNVP